MFITHHKCATGWLVRVLKEIHLNCFSDYKFFRTAHSKKFPNKIENFKILVFANGDYAFLSDKIVRAAHIIRNPLSIITSAYFSHRYTHPTHNWPELHEQRSKLEGMDIREGLISTIEFLESEHFFGTTPGPLYSLDNFNYLDNRILNIRMEDLVKDPNKMFPVMFNHLKLHVDDSAIQSATFNNTFEKLKSNSQFQNNGHSHFRSGQSNNWKDYIDNELAKEIKYKYRKVFNFFYPDII